jgi:hypothetical protein
MGFDEMFELIQDLGEHEVKLVLSQLIGTSRGEALEYDVNFKHHLDFALKDVLAYKARKGGIVDER